MPHATLHSSAWAGSASHVMHGTISWLWQLTRAEDNQRHSHERETVSELSDREVLWCPLCVVVCCWLSYMAHVSFSISAHARQRMRVEQEAGGSAKVSDTIGRSSAVG